MPTAAFEALPATARRAIFQFDPELETKLLLGKAQVQQDRMDALADAYHACKDRRAGVVALAQARCPHLATVRESDGDFHQSGWETVCRLCNKYL